MAVLPKLKKKVGAFLVSEEGKISKEAILKAGIILGSLAISSALVAKEVAAADHTSHGNSFENTRSQTGGFVGEHTHHASHASGTATGTGTGTGTYY